MRKTIVGLSAILFAAGLCVFIGCQKSKNSDTKQQETSVQLVPDSVALKVAQSFNPSDFFDERNPTNHYPVRTRLTGNNKIAGQFKFNDSYGNPALFVFNFENDGFLFVSADYQLQPVLAYVHTGKFKKDTVPSGFIQWLQKTMDNIEIVRKGLYDNSKVATAAWTSYMKQNKIPSSLSTAMAPKDPCLTTSFSTTVGPLLPVTWGQGCTYNELCPDKTCNISCGTTHAWTGCIATAAAQIIKYWHANNVYGYDFASMPATSGNYQVQKLMKDIGSYGNANMNYGCDISRADGNTVPGFLKANYWFASADRAGYNYQTVKTNLDSHWPVLLDGNQTKTGSWTLISWFNSYTDYHEWVCDGYQESGYSSCTEGVSTLYFHMNWGWHEISGNDYNGWFAFNNWNVQTSAGNVNYQYNQNMTYNIHP